MRLRSLRTDPGAATATRGFGFLNVPVPGEDDLPACAAHLDDRGVQHTDVMSGATGRLVGFHDLDGHELTFCARTEAGAVRGDAVRSVRSTGA